MSVRKQSVKGKVQNRHLFGLPLLRPLIHANRGQRQNVISLPCEKLWLPCDTVKIVWPHGLLMHT